jgi:RimJ/RimL family protein N-acetyltransferase
MRFPDKYNCLGQNEFQKGSFKIIPIRYEDRFNIMKWRNEQTYHLRQDKLLTEVDQDAYFNNIITKLFKEDEPSQILFSFMNGEKCIGYGGLVHINWIDKNAEISFIMKTDLETKYFEIYWSNFLNLIEKVAFCNLSFHKIYTYAFDLRPKLYNVLINSGYNEEARLVEHCSFSNKFIDILIHSKFNYD